MRRMGSVLKVAAGGVERNMVTAGEGWFLLFTILLLALPEVLLELLYSSGLPQLPFEVLIFGLGCAIAGSYYRLCEKRCGSR